jgi:DNA-binding CsgD family transcriptional regulator
LKLIPLGGRDQGTVEIEERFARQDLRYGASAFVVGANEHPREIEILEQLKAGLSYEKIAANLFISYGTVRKHIENTYRKLQVHNKVEAVQKAVRENIVRP